MNSNEITRALNLAWEALQRNHPDLPLVMIVTGRRRHKAEFTQNAHHVADMWRVPGREEGNASEIVIFGERLLAGGREVMQSLMHEAAHELARVREIKDTSNRNRFHNKKFVSLAEELGMEAPECSGGPTLGFSHCTLPDRIAEIYNYEITRLDQACQAWVAPQAPEVPKERKKSRKALCECPEDNEITWAKKYQKKLDETGYLPLVCNTCKQVFVPEDEEEEAA